MTMAAVALPIAPPVTFDAAIEVGGFRGLILADDGSRVARTLHLHPSRDNALVAADRLWKRLRAENAEVDL